MGQQQQAQWQDAVADHNLKLFRGEDEIRQLRAEFDEVQHRCAEVRREESRLEAAAHQDRLALEDLRRQLRRSDARNAGLEAEALHLGVVGPPTAAVAGVNRPWSAALAGEPLAVSYP